MSDTPADRDPPLPDTLTAYLRKIGDRPLLTQAEETALADRIRQGDATAKHTMISANLRLVVKIAFDYRHASLPLTDIIAEGNVGLIKAVERFNPTFNRRFASYAVWWIKHAIQAAIAAGSQTITIPLGTAARIAKISRTEDTLAAELRRAPTNDEIAKAAGVKPRRIAHLRSVASRVASLSTPINDDGDATLADLIADDTQTAPSDEITRAAEFSALREYIAKLPPRHAEIITLRYGLAGDAPQTLNSIAGQLGLTRERIRQIERTCRHRLRAMIEHTRKIPTL